MNIFLYGPSGAGKSTTGAILAQNLDMDFIDLDNEIEKKTYRKIADIFSAHGEEAFRNIESEVLQNICASHHSTVIALGGGTLLDMKNRAEAENSGTVLCLTADFNALYKRLIKDSTPRPKLEGKSPEKLQELLTQRHEHYASFHNMVDVTNLTPQAAAGEAQICLGKFRVHGMEKTYDIQIRSNSLDQIGEVLKDRLSSEKIVLVCDETVRKLYADRVMTSLKKSNLCASIITIPAGEKYKTMDTVMQLWQGFIQASVERSSTILALGGGVVGDLTGFATSTFLRGVAWVNIPTTLLSMVDASIGGKVGANLPQGKNLIGAFHAPQLVYTDPRVLGTLPKIELRNGMAEIIKHAVIADRQLYQLCKSGFPKTPDGIDQLINRAVAVKTHFIEADPFEKDLRQALNFGHTVGHGVEMASGYKISHGESVSIGMTAEAQLAEQIGLADQGLSGEIASMLSKASLQVHIPDWMDRQKIIESMCLDKKRHNGKIHFALPESIGRVRVGVTVDDWKTLIKL